MNFEPKEKHYQILRRIAQVRNVFCWNSRTWESYDPYSKHEEIRNPMRLDGRMCQKLLKEGYLKLVLKLEWRKQRSAIYDLTAKGKQELDKYNANS